MKLINRLREVGLSVLAGVVVMVSGCGGPSDPPPNSVANVPGPKCPAFIEASKGLPTKDEWKAIPSVGDVNGDGLADFAVLPRKMDGARVFVSDGVGGWTEIAESIRYKAGISCGVGTRLKDLNGDGHVDLLVADHCQGVHVFYNDGAGGWTPGSEGIPRNEQGVDDADAADIDGDGYLDIVALSAFSSGFLVLRGNAEGTWSVWPDSGLPATGLGFAVKLIDVNRDGRVDLLATFQPVATDRRGVPPPPSKVWMQDETGRFKPGMGFPDKGRFFGIDIWRRPDRPIPDVITALSGARGGLWRFESKDAATWVEAGRVDNAGFPEQGAMFIGLDVVDMDGDGCADIVTSEGSSGKTWLAMGDCKGGWQFCPEATLPQAEMLPPWGVATADFNGDGRRDVVASYGRGSLGGVHVWFQTGTKSKNP